MTDESFQSTHELNMQRWKRLWEEGHGEALFDAVWWCLSQGIPAPKWVAVAFAERWHRFQTGIPDSPENPSKVTLGGAFGIRRGKGQRPSDDRRRMLATLVWQRVKDRHPKDEGLFEQVAEELNQEGAPENLAQTHKILYGIEPTCSGQG